MRAIEFAPLPKLESNRSTAKKSNNFLKPSMATPEQQMRTLKKQMLSMRSKLQEPITACTTHSQKKHAQPGLCIAAGVCLCEGDGIQLLQLRNSFLVSMKEVFQVGLPERKLLAEGWCVAHVFRDEGESELAAGEARE